MFQGTIFPFSYEDNSLFLPSLLSRSQSSIFSFFPMSFFSLLDIQQVFFFFPNEYSYFFSISFYSALVFSSRRYPLCFYSVSVYSISVFPLVVTPYALVFRFILFHFIFSSSWLLLMFFFQFSFIPLYFFSSRGNPLCSFYRFLLFHFIISPRGYSLSSSISVFSFFCFLSFCGVFSPTRNFQLLYFFSLLTNVFNLHSLLGIFLAWI